MKLLRAWFTEAVQGYYSLSMRHPYDPHIPGLAIDVQKFQALGAMGMSLKDAEKQNKVEWHTSLTGFSVKDLEYLRDKINELLDRG